MHERTMCQATKAACGHCQDTPLFNKLVKCDERQDEGAGWRGRSAGEEQDNS